MPLDALRRLKVIAIGDITPDRTVLIDLPVAAGLKRREAGSTADLTRFETDEQAHGATFHERVRDGYIEMAQQEPQRWRVVDGSSSPISVAQSVWSAVADLFDS